MDVVPEMQVGHTPLSGSYLLLHTNTFGNIPTDMAVCLGKKSKPYQVFLVQDSYCCIRQVSDFINAPRHGGVYSMLDFPIWCTDAGAKGCAYIDRGFQSFCDRSSVLLSTTGAL